MKILRQHLQHHQKYEVLGINLAQEKKDVYEENHKEDITEGLYKQRFTTIKIPAGFLLWNLTS